HAVADLQVQAELELGGEQNIDLDLAARGLKSGAMQWHQLTLGAKGTRNAHQIELKLESEQAPTAQLLIDAGLDAKNSWSGTLQALTL
ncbi:hypothetical protein QQ73_10350, partial [Candidatus Endoriftia persephone str. Guaymas]|nr:hypothetical protein [Candidatus Endoriftia persephone str. Guaymas]